MKTWILASLSAVALAACLSGVKGDGGADACQSDYDCGGGSLGMQCSSGSCVKTPCDPTDLYPDQRCQMLGFGLVCDIPSETCVERCVGAGDCGFDAVCEEQICEDQGPTSTLGANATRAIGPGAAGGGGATTDFPFTEGGDGNPYDY